MGGLLAFGATHRVSYGVVFPPMNTVIAPIDFSRASRGVVDEAIRIAQSVQGRVVVMHVVKPAVFASAMPPLMTTSHKLTAKVERVARAHLQLMQRRLMRKGISVETVCATGSPIRCIVEQAELQTARYIVLGAHRHGALRQWVVGGTASGVLKQAGCPVVVVPPWKKAVAA
jgi:nucleotide-binding universal stress UspA family protein